MILCYILLRSWVAPLKELGLVRFEFDSGGPSRIEVWWVIQRVYTNIDLTHSCLQLFVVADPEKPLLTMERHIGLVACSVVIWHGNDLAAHARGPVD